MSLLVSVFRVLGKRQYNKRDAGLVTPPDIQRRDNIAYGPYGIDNLLDVYTPKGTRALLPTIISVHGGGFTFGNKALYQHYCLSLAQRGFAVVNFNYRLAPEAAFPAPLEDTNMVLEWVAAHAAEYHIDLGKLFMVGDSAGAQIASQYAAILSNPAYAQVFGMKTPPLTLRGLGLNCGLFDLQKEAVRDGVIGKMRHAYFGRNPDLADPRLRPLDFITAAYPPASITTASHDHIRANSPAMAEVLQSHGVQVVCKQYGTEADEHLKHVFHLNVRDETAKQCNDEQCAFFLSLVAE